MSEYFPTYVRTKVLVLDCVRGLEDALESTADQWENKPLCLGFVRRIRNNRLGCFKHLPVDKEDGNLKLSSKQLRQYKRYLELLRKAMKTFWGSTVDAREFLAACLLLTEYIWDKYEKNQKVPCLNEKLYWNDLIKTLDDLYGEYDPNLAAMDKINRADEIGGLFIKIIEGG